MHPSCRRKRRKMLLLGLRKPVVCFVGNFVVVERSFGLLSRVLMCFGVEQIARTGLSTRSW